MASPRFTANQPFNIGGGSQYNGTSPRLGEQLANLNAYQDVLAMWCNYGDPVCASGSEPVNIEMHWSYYDQYTKVASEWILATVLGRTSEQLDLDLDGRLESVVLTGANNTASGQQDNSTSVENAQTDIGSQISNKFIEVTKLAGLGLGVIIISQCVF
jgi:hypothetical protein